MPSEKREGEVFLGVWVEIRDMLKELSTAELIAELRARDALPAVPEKKEEKEESIPEEDNDEWPDEDPEFTEWGWDRSQKLGDTDDEDLQLELFRRFIYDGLDKPHRMERGTIIEYESLQELQLYDAVHELQEKLGTKKLLDILSSL